MGSTTNVTYVKRMDKETFPPPVNRAPGIGRGSTCGCPQTKVRPNWNHAAVTNVSESRPLDGFHLGNKVWRISDWKCNSYEEILIKIQLLTVKLKPSILSTKHMFQDLNLSGQRLWILLSLVKWPCNLSEVYRRKTSHFMTQRPALVYYTVCWITQQLF